MKTEKNKIEFWDSYQTIECAEMKITIDNQSKLTDEMTLHHVQKIMQLKYWPEILVNRPDDFYSVLIQEQIKFTLQFYQDHEIRFVVTDYPEARNMVRP